MGVVLDSWLGEALATVLAAVVALYAWFCRRYCYWTRRGVPQAQPQVPFGNLRRSVLGQTRLEFILQEVYHQFRGEKYVGIYGVSKPMLVLIDPDLIRLVLVKDFDSFRDRGVPFNEREPLNHNLFFIGGNKWRRLRTKLTPTFTSGKLKMMCQTMQDCGRELVEVLEDSASRGEVVEMREVAARYATDVIASVAFGVECNCQRNPEAEFRRWGRKVFEPSLKAKVARVMHDFVPALARALRIAGGTEEVSQFFRNMVRETVEYREKNGVSRGDFMQLLIQLRNRGCVDDDRPNGLNDTSSDVDDWKLSMDEVAAQAFVFFLAGFETSSTTMSFALYELALNPEVQKRLQEEVDATMRNSSGQLTYDAIAEMRYLDKVVSGMRLGLLQTKIGLAYLMSKFEVHRCEQTKVPIEFNTVSFIPMPTTGIQLRLAKRN